MVCIAAPPTPLTYLQITPSCFHLCLSLILASLLWPQTRSLPPSLSPPYLHSFARGSGQPSPRDRAGVRVCGQQTTGEEEEEGEEKWCGWFQDSSKHGGHGLSYTLTRSVLTASNTPSRPPLFFKSLLNPMIVTVIHHYYYYHSHLALIFAFCPLLLYFSL